MLEALEGARRSIYKRGGDKAYLKDAHTVRLTRIYSELGDKKGKLSYIENTSS